MRPAFLIAGGLLMVATSYALLSQVGAAYTLPLIVAGTVLMSLGLGPVFILTTDLIVSAAPPERAGAAAAVSETGAEFGGVLGIAILGSIGIAVYRSMMAGVIPAAVPFEAAEAARDTLGGALAVGAELSAADGAGLIGAARAAFSQGFEIIAVLCAIISIAAAMVAAVLLRRLRAGGSGAAAPGAADPAGSLNPAAGQG